MATLTERMNQVRYWSGIALHHLPPNRSRSLFVLGHPRTGTNWMCRILGHYFGIPIYEPWLRTLPAVTPVVFHLHRFAEVPRRTVYVIRDGRDVAVSYYFKALNTWRSSAAPYKAMEACCPAPLRHDTIRENLPAFIGFIFEGQAPSSIPYDRHVREAARRHLYSLRYEDLIERSDATIAGAVRHLTGAEPDMERVKSTVEATSFERRTGRRRGEEVVRSGISVRKGIVGDWKSHFSREAAIAFDGYAGDVLVELGYEPDRSWVDGLAP